MSEALRIYFELDEGVDPEVARSALEAEVATLASVEQAEVVVPNQRVTGLEIAATIGVGIVVAKSATEAIDVLAELVDSLTKLVRSIQGLKAAVVETHEGGKPLEELTAADIERLSGQ